MSQEDGSFACCIGLSEPRANSMDRRILVLAAVALVALSQVVNLPFFLPASKRVLSVQLSLPHCIREAASWSGWLACQLCYHTVTDRCCSRAHWRKSWRQACPCLKFHICQASASCHHCPPQMTSHPSLRFQSIRSALQSSLQAFLASNGYLYLLDSPSAMSNLL